MKQARCKNKLGKHNPETDSIIISVKEARKILGKEMSDKLSDEDLARVIGATKKESNSDSDSHMVISAGVTICFANVFRSSSLKKSKTSF